mgnify:CR=1 FL=1
MSNSVAEAEPVLNGNVEEDEAAYAESLRRQQPILWFVTLAVPLLAIPALLVSVGLIAGWPVAHRLALTIVATCFFFGRFAILAGSNGAEVDSGTLLPADGFFTSGQLALLVFFLDTVAAVLIVFHMSVVFHLPVVGVRIRTLVEEGRQLVQSQKWMKRLTVAGVVAFVMFPLAATGSVGGSILGRLLGLSHFGTLAAVITGSILGCSTMYFGASLISTWLDRDDPVVQIAGLAIVVALVILLTLRYRKLTRTAEVA